MNELKSVIRKTKRAYDRMDIRSAIHACYHDILNLRDTFVKLVGYAECYTSHNSKVIASLFMILITLMYPVIPHFCETIHRNKYYQMMIGFVLKDDRTSVHGIAHKLDECHNFIQNMIMDDVHREAELRFTYKFITNIVSEISSNIAVFGRKKINVDKITVYCAAPGHITNDNTRIIFEIIDEIGFPDNNECDEPIEFETSTLIPIINRILVGSNCASSDSKKKMGEIIREYRRIDEFRKAYGVEFFNHLRSSINVRSIMSEILPQFMISYGFPHNVEIREVTDTVTDADNANDKDIANLIKFCQPYIRYHEN